MKMKKIKILLWLIFPSTLITCIEYLDFRTEDRELLHIFFVIEYVNKLYYLSQAVIKGYKIYM